MTNSPSGADPAVDRLLQRARAELDRVLAVDLPAQIAAGALVVDIRPVGQRLRDGDLPGAVVVDRNVLEWRLDPTSPHRLPIADDAADRPVIVVCNEGYSSSLAAASLRHLGLGGATDLVGGFQEWLATPRGSSSPSCRRVVLNGGRREQVTGCVAGKASEESDSGVLSATTTTKPGACPGAAQ